MNENVYKKLRKFNTKKIKSSLKMFRLFVVKKYCVFPHKK